MRIVDDRPRNVYPYTSYKLITSHEPKPEIERSPLDLSTTAAEVAKDSARRLVKALQHFASDVAAITTPVADIAAALDPHDVARAHHAMDRVMPLLQELARHFQAGGTAAKAGL